MAAIAVGDDVSLASLNALKTASAALRLAQCAGRIAQDPGLAADFDNNVLGLFETLRPLLLTPRMIAVYAELGTLESGGVAALFAREIPPCAWASAHRQPVQAGDRQRAKVTYLADTQLFT